MKVVTTIKHKINAFLSYMEALSEANLQKLNESQREYALWAGGYFWRKFFTSTGILAVIYYNTGWEGLLYGVGTMLVLIAFGVITRKKSDNFITASLLFFLSLFCVNMFFDDWKKTLAFPLAYIFYRLGKVFCADPLKEVLTRMEEVIPFVRHANSILRTPVYLTPPTSLRKSSKLRTPSVRVVPTGHRQDNRKPPRVWSHPAKKRKIK